MEISLVIRYIMMTASILTVLEHPPCNLVATRPGLLLSLISLGLDHVRAANTLLGVIKVWS